MLAFLYGNKQEGGAAELAARQPLPPPLAALRDAMLTDASALQSRTDELREYLEVRLKCRQMRKDVDAAVHDIECILCKAVCMYQGEAMGRRIWSFGAAKALQDLRLGNNLLRYHGLL